jgi:site-specific recombinase XerD
MKKFLNYLNLKKIVPEKEAHFYLIWVSKFIRFSNDKPIDQIDDNDISRFVNRLSKNYQQWQVDQAAQAIQNLFYKRDEGEAHLIQSGNTDEQWKAVANEMINMLRLKQRSRETEKSYMYWLRDLYRFLRGQSTRKKSSKKFTFS